MTSRKITRTALMSMMILLLLLSCHATSSTAARLTTGNMTLVECLSSKNIPVSLPSSPDFKQLAKPYNLRLVYTPVVIVLPTTAQHVSDAVVCAGKTGIKVQAKSGGHSYASFSSGGRDGSMVVDLQGMSRISVDSTSGVAIVGGGVRLGNLAQGIHDQGQRAMPHGTCPGVGVGGHLTHGGYGYTSRTWGLALDRIVALDAVLADGSIVHATEMEYADIYWALRGAADSIGIVLNFYLQTEPAPASVTRFSYSFSNMFSDQDIFTNTLLHLQYFATNSSVIDDKIAFGIYLDGSGFSLSGSRLGSLNDFKARIEPELLRLLPTPSSATVQSLDWISYLINLSGQSRLTEPLTGYDAHDNFFAKSITVPESDGLTKMAVGDLFNYITTMTAPAKWYVIINLYGGPGSAINAKNTTFACYADRDSLWVFQIYGESASSINFIDGLSATITGAQPDTRFGAYLNYLDPSLSPAVAHELYYGIDVYSRLMSIKRSVDPDQIFWNPQAVGN